MQNIIRFLLWPITCLVQLVSRLVSHFFNHPNGGLHFAIFVQGLIIIGLGVWIGFQVIANRQAGPLVPTFPKIAVEAVTARVGNFEQFVSVVGTMRSNKSVVLKPEIDAKIKDIFVKSGKKVKKGEKLLTLDDEMYQARLSEAQAKLVNAGSVHKRAEALFKKGAISEKDKDEAHANLLKSMADLEFSEAQLAKTMINAPFEGTLGIVDLSPGRYVKPGDDLFTVDDMDPMKIDFKVNETILSKFRIGDEIVMDVEGLPDNKYHAKIEAIDTNVDPLGHSVRVQATFDNDGDLRPGLFAKVKLRTDIHQNTIIIPESAVESRGKQEFVYIVEQGVAKMAPIKTGARNGEEVQVVKGLVEGDKIIVSGQMKVQPNYPVFIVPSRVQGK